MYQLLQYRRRYINQNTNKTLSTQKNHCIEDTDVKPRSFLSIDPSIDPFQLKAAIDLF